MSPESTLPTHVSTCWASLNLLQETRTTLFSLLFRTEPLWARNLKMQRRDSHEYHWDAQDTSPSTLLLGAPGIPSSAPPEPPFPCTTRVSGILCPLTMTLSFAPPPEVDSPKTGLCSATLRACGDSMIPKFTVLNHHLGVLLSDSRMYLWGPVEQRLYQTTGKKWWLYHQNPVLPGGVTVCVLWPITQVELPEEWDTIPNPPQKHPILSGKTRSTPQTKPRMTHASPTGNGRSTHITQFMFSLKQK